MRYVLDTNVVSEWSKPDPAEPVVAWLYSQRPTDLAISVITYHEVAYGIEQALLGQRRRRLEAWFERVLLDTIGDRIIPLDRPIALRWAEVRAQVRAAGRTIPDFDAGIMATASVRALTIVTRDQHFDVANVPLVNPWIDER